ncbi:hypothetical protein F5878DRAFT_690523 [Lentinula raphanica]|uniref:Uncharacterized protein n=1 Tax=Lentinula raphanica TaxID=153919 RepID=A0AA38P4U6_9AGAR|nr:hypothetical protein F5878DRAFT_690523 [Lentinula raphanica]
MCLYPVPLPNELLHWIVEDIAYTPKVPWRQNLGDTVNWQLRRACLPFLFREIWIRHDEDAKKLEEHIALCARFIKTLFLCDVDDLTEVGEQIVSRILPQLEQLLDVKLAGCLKRTDLLKTMIAHPTVTSVLVNVLPNVSMCDLDLSKVILNRASSEWPLSPLEQYFDRGMRLLSLILEPPFVDNQSRNNNDKTIRILLAKANGLSSQEWLVTEITMRTGHLLTNNLSLLASSFPELEVLRLNFDSDLGKYDNIQEDLSSVFAQFSYLRVVHIVDIVRRLPFGSEIENRMRPGRQVETTPTLHEIRVGAERELLAFISCVAKQVRTLDLVYIDDAGSGYDDDEEYIQLWGFKGWLHVLNSKRVIGGTLALDHTI